MKRRTLLPSVCALALLAACASPSVFSPRADLLGAPAPLAAAKQTIVITPDTTAVNVTGGDTVKFIVGDKQFAWSFTVARSVNSFVLNRVAPPGTLTREVVAYVEPDPSYASAAHAAGGKHHREG